MLKGTGREGQGKGNNTQGNTKTEGKGIDNNQGKATSKAKGKQRYGEHLLRGQAQREGLREQNRDQREHRGKAKMEGKVHENAAGKADAGGQ